MSKQLVLKGTRGPLSGRSFVVLSGDCLTIGRLPECGIALVDDPTVSRQHCQIEFDPPYGRLVHLSQTSGTFVNGEFVAEIVLKSGDEITLGSDNAFEVAIQEGPSPSALRTSSVTEPTNPTVHTRQQFGKLEIGEGIVRYTSPDPAFNVARLLDILGHKGPFSVWMDCRKAGRALEELPEPVNYLFSWVPPAAAKGISPVYLSSVEVPDLAGWAMAAWNKDAVVVFGSSAPGEGAMAHWRNQVAPATEEGPPKTLTAYYLPGLLRMMFAHQPIERVKPLMSGLSWILVESPDSPSQWELFSGPEMEMTLRSAGCVAIES